MALSHYTILLDSDIEGTRKPDARALHVEPHDPEEEERADPAPVHWKPKVVALSNRPREQHMR